MPASEFVQWLAYFKVKGEEEKRRWAETQVRQGLDSMRGGAMKRGRMH